MDTGFELTLIPEEPKCHCGPPVRIEARSQEINGVLAWVCFRIGPVSIWAHPAVIFSVLECIIGIDVLSNWLNSYIVSLTITSLMVGKPEEKLLELPLPWKIINENQCLISGGISEINAFVKDLSKNEDSHHIAVQLIYLAYDQLQKNNLQFHRIMTCVPWWWCPLLNTSISKPI